eukprot:TRINITY_DN620_c0_g1_i1.p1 TRINITY_DN620_c0_g1~~TRINITY_DN620_c0_g1_i1.p1  ORF type:complete len:394 (-),score=113.17 TRINITY_DN620_c0_g1_i1:47-1228(-)
MRATIFISVLLVSYFALSTAETIFKETFPAGWEKRWVKAYPKKDENADGEWGWSAGKFYNDAEKDKGLQTTQDAKFYTISAQFPKEFSNKDKELIIQYTVKHEQNIDCGGGYVKLFPASLDQEKMNSESEYNIMFGPDICGPTKKTHVIFSHGGKNHLIKKEIRPESDEFTHIYRLVVKPDNTYKVFIDGSEKESGSLDEDWDILPPKQIKDPNSHKPSDWVDEKEIDDPEDKKPEGWDDIPAEIPDPEATKPDDWDEDLDGEWEAPQIPNPEYKGVWKPKRIPNPAYKGEWVHPLIDNPEYHPNPALYAYDSFKYIGIDVWQVKSGTIFDNILITTSEEEADKLLNEWEIQKEGEKKAHDEHQERERKKAEEVKAADEDSKDNDESDDKDEL